MEAPPLRSRSVVAALALVALLTLTAFPPGAVGITGAAGPLKLTTVASGLSSPLFVTHAGDGSGRLFIVQQTGIVKQLKDGVLSNYLDIHSKTKCGTGGPCGEQGLLSIAFHPDFETNGLLYVSYTQTGTNPGTNVIEEYKATPPATGTPVAQEILLSVNNPFANHNGGWIAFGPDGYLYWAKGDGGSGGDPMQNGQNLNTLLGKMLRIDVNVPTGYAIPPTNPFAGQAGKRGEIWAYGLRNPWRPSFDRGTGDLWIADVGQNNIEEVNYQPAAAAGGANYGWGDWEGHTPYRPTQALTLASIQGTTFPVYEYPHVVGQGAPACSITGGYVYRGSAMPAFQGAYFFGDYCSGTISAAPMATGTASQAGVIVPVPLVQSSASLTSFGEDEAGELYLTSFSGGVVQRFVQGP
jgi:glucose/arabinose dehydrogenase